MNLITKPEYKAFKEAIIELLEEACITSGTCLALAKKLAAKGFEYSLPYNFARTILNESTFNPGISPTGQWTQDRENYLILLSVLSRKDMNVLIDSYNAEIKS